MKQYIGMVTSDWSECLSPSGPFDMITFHYPHLQAEVETVFKGYTGNAITLAQAMAQIDALLPEPMGKGLLDAYLKEGFDIYADVPAFMDWCRRNGILFMINSTGAIGYFQRAIAMGMLARPEVLAASPLVRFEETFSDPQTILPIMEISDKPMHSANVAQRLNIPHERIVVIGDSGGDGPHFEWGARIGATLVASQAKPSLLDYCCSHGIDIHHHWNPDPARGVQGEDGSVGWLDLNHLIGVVRNTLGR